MLSDALLDAIQEIDRYLNNPLYADHYNEAMRKRVERIRNEMQTIVAELSDPMAHGTRQ